MMLCISVSIIIQSVIHIVCGLKSHLKLSNILFALVSCFRIEVGHTDQVIPCPKEVLIIKGAIIELYF